MSLFRTTALARTGSVGYWGLAETTGTSAADSKGTNTGTYSGGFVLNKSGAWVPQYSYEPSPSFDGTSGKVTIADNSALNPTVFSASIFYYPTAAAGASAYRLLFGKDNGLGTIGWFLALYNGQNLVGAMPTVSNTTSPSVALNQWHVAHMTYDGTNVRVYSDGVDVTLVTAKTLTLGTNPLLIGASPSGQFFQGQLQDAVLYNRVLTAAEIAYDVALLGVNFFREVDRMTRFNAPTFPRVTKVADANYTMVPSDQTIIYTSLTAARTVTLSPGIAEGQTVTIIDGAGTAATNAITISGAAAASSVNTNYGRKQLTWTGSVWTP